MNYNTIDALMLKAAFELEAEAENNIIKLFSHKDSDGKTRLDPAIAANTMSINKYISIIESSKPEKEKPKYKNKPYTEEQKELITKQLQEQLKQEPSRYTPAQSRKIEEIINNAKEKIKEGK